jgi:hypothetical protein
MGVEEKVILEILKQKEQDKNRDRAWNDLTEKGKHIIH